MEPKGIQSIELGFRLLEALERSEAALSLSELSQRTGLSPSKARNYLVSLKRVALVQQDGVTGRYDLGPGALRLGLTALRRLEPIDLAYAEMRRALPAVGATLFLSVWGNVGPVIVRWLEGPHQVTVEVRSGSVLPVLNSATGRVFAAFLPSALTEAVIAAQSADTAIDRDSLADLRRAVRADGLGRVDGDLLPGISGLAAPILDHEDRLRAVVTAIGKRGQIDLTSGGRLASELRALTQRVTHKIGGDAPAAAAR